MNGTPRLRSAYPRTPPTAPSAQRSHASPVSPTDSTASYSSGGLRDIGELSAKKSDPLAPLIPLETIDAPKQRLYVAAAYVALFAYRLFDFLTLCQDEEESLWLFMKWVAIDGVFLFGLPSMRIPWLEWSSMTMTILFLFHAVFDGILMFRISVGSVGIFGARALADAVQSPFEAVFFALAKMLYDREIAISEHRIRPGSVMGDSSHITGAYTIHVLPEG